MSADALRCQQRGSTAYDDAHLLPSALVALCWPVAACCTLSWESAGVGKLAGRLGVPGGIGEQLRVAAAGCWPDRACQARHCTLNLRWDTVAATALAARSTSSTVPATPPTAICKQAGSAQATGHSDSKQERKARRQEEQEDKKQ